MAGLAIGVAGAGLLGRLLAWRLGRAGHRVDVFDPAPGPAPSFDGRQAAGFSAAGMLSPLAELDSSSADVAALGWRSIALWSDIVATLKARPHFAELRQSSPRPSQRPGCGHARPRCAVRSS